ncbi:hypothetical protein PGQ11_001895 [Apiospora arundinis]|uniref:Mid2 domain-containing protein n=1 Tax=Apiospora arundinis TaxID=335852 RepID=A0ABR2JGI1_9PEZI
MEGWGRVQTLQNQTEEPSPPPSQLATTASSHVDLGIPGYPPVATPQDTSRPKPGTTTKPKSETVTNPIFPDPATMVMTWKTTHPSPTSSIPSSPSSRSSNCSTANLEGTTVYLSASPGSSSGAGTGGGGGGGGMDEGLKLGLGLGIGIGIPLMTLLGFGCFLLWRLLRKICPIDFRRSATSSGNAEKQQHRHKKDSLDDGDDDTAVAGPAELLSRELYEAEGASRQIRPAELGT